MARVRPLPHVRSVTSPFSAAGAHQIAPRDNIAFAQVQFSTDTADIPTGAVKQVVSAAQTGRTRGSPSSSAGIRSPPRSRRRPGPSEGIGITAAILIMLLAFGSVVAMGLPIITALAGLGIGVALLELLTHLLVVPTFSPEMATMIGIGVGIDYALFIVTRYRQGIFEGRDPRDAVVTAHMTAGRSVLFAGSTVVISLFGLYLIGQAYMIGLATACIAAVLMVLCAALTLLPAMLGFAGKAIDKLHLPGLLQSGGPPPENGFWHRWSRFVQRRAWFDRRGGRAHPGRPGPPDVQHASGLHRRRQRPDVADHEPGLRPAGPGLRAGIQRAVGRGGRHARAERRGRP